LFVTIWERRDDLEHIHSPNVYLYVSLRRKIIKEMEEQRNTCDMIEVDETAYITFGREEIIIRDEVKFQQKEELKKALNKLSKRQKEVIYLHYYNGLSYGEIEDILSINRQSVRNHIYRAMETLRSQLDMEIMKLVSALLIAILFLH
jgi:RNA polymerase sigma factor (sigma-70 family)